MLPGLICNACQLPLEGMLTLKNVNKLPNVDPGNIFCIKMFAHQVRLPYETNQLAYIGSQDDNSIPIDALSKRFPK